MGSKSRSVGSNHPPSVAQTVETFFAMALPHLLLKQSTELQDEVGPSTGSTSSFLESRGNDATINDENLVLLWDEFYEIRSRNWELASKFLNSSVVFLKPEKCRVVWIRQSWTSTFKFNIRQEHVQTDSSGKARIAQFRLSQIWFCCGLRFCSPGCANRNWLTFQMDFSLVIIQNPVKELKWSCDGEIWNFTSEIP